MQSCLIVKTRTMATCFYKSPVILFIYILIKNGKSMNYYKYQVQGLNNKSIYIIIQLWDF